MGRFVRAGVAAPLAVVAAIVPVRPAAVGDIARYSAPRTLVEQCG